MRPVVLGFSGEIASGKSHISSAMAQTLKAPRASFGDYVRLEAQRRGLTASREILQDVGAQLISEGWEKFCQSVISSTSWQPSQNLVIDGVRHIEAISTIRSLIQPMVLFHIFVEVDDSIREKRLLTKGIINKEQLAKLESHSTEVQVKTRLRSIADLIVDGSREEKDLVQEICKRIKQL